MPRTIQVRSRNHSARLLRKQIPCTVPTVLRLGSFTSTEEIFTPQQIRSGIIEINTVNSCKNSNDKLLMKQCFDNCAVPTANWALLSEVTPDNERQVTINTNARKAYNTLRYPLIIKNRHSSRGRGIYFVPDEATLIRYKRELTQTAHIIEEFRNFSKEYRVHASSLGSFYANRKMLLRDIPEDQRFHRHHENTVWILPNNPDFDAPTNIEAMYEAAALAVEAVGLTIGCVDVLIQQNRPGRQPEFIILETNSAPALGETTAPIYIQELTRLTTSLNPQR